jgi:hypothetical protein
MSTVHFTTRVGPDGTIRPPAGTTLPEGEIEVSIRPAENANLEDLSRQIAVRRGLDWDTLAEDVRAILQEDAEHEIRGTRRPWPGPGAFKGSILYMAPDFDAPLEDMREYME